MNVKKLAFLFWFIFFTMIAVTSWASFKLNLWTHAPVLLRDPWAVATLFDAYFAFLTFYLWVCYKEVSTLKKIIWFVLIMALGNIAMSAYMLVQIYRLKEDSGWSDLLSSRNV